MFAYTAYRLGIRSSLELPDVPPGGNGDDVAIRLGSVDLPLPRYSGDTSNYFIGRDGAHLSWPDIGRFLVRAGREITVDPAEGVALETLRAFLLGPVLAVLLWQRGLAVLHASAVAKAGQAAAFLGSSGKGKSTIAASLLLHGYGLLADDVTAVNPRREGAEILPGSPLLKLHPDAAALLTGSHENPRRIHPAREKVVALAAQFASGPHPLRRIYVLAEAEHEYIAPLSPREALFELVRHTYILRLLGAGGIRSIFLQCAGLAGAVPARRLLIPRSLARLPAVIERLEEDLDRAQV